MIEIAQFKSKIKTHGLSHALFYSAEYLLRPFWRRIWTEPFLKSYSQRYEDLIIDELLGHKKTGTYLDIGAFDPHKLSNTKRFYDRGWRGCNVEPHPGRFAKIARQRPADTNLNVGLSDVAGTLMFYDIVPEVYGTFSEERAKQLENQGARIRAQFEIRVITLKDLFAEYLAETTVDFCTIDTEGLDLKILQNNDWGRFKPRIICVEAALLGHHPKGTAEPTQVESFLATVGYTKCRETIEFGVPLNEIFLSEVGTANTAVTQRSYSDSLAVES